jgi:multiple sugar transport system substrate-binding protein
VGLVGVALASTTLAACGGDDGGGGGDGDTITMWTLEDVQARITKTEAIADAYAKDSGVDVEVVAISEDQYATQLSNAAASGELPDVVAALGLSGVGDLGRNELLDTDMAQQVVDDLGTDTFSERALQLTQDTEGNQLGVPSDGWAQLLFYRKDLFEQAGLEPPTTYDAIAAAAAELDSSEVSGITAATAPGDSFTQQTFEHLALANGCQLTDDEGTVVIDSAECVDTMTWYTDLMASYSPSGKQDVDTTRATYFAGKAAMIVWSSFLLDELAGLRADALPTCPECREDPSFLVENTGIVSSLQGPMGSEPAQYGEITSWAITDGANPETADFVEYMMSDAYVDWLSLAPEGKVPVRSGTEENPTEYVDAWPSLKAGEDRKEPLNSIFDQETLDTILASPDTFQRWGFEQGEGALAGAMLAELPIPLAISDVLAGDLSPEEAIAQAQDDVQRIAEGL